MSGIFTNKRRGLVSPTKFPTTFVIKNSDGSLKRSYLPPGMPFDVLNGAVSDIPMASEFLTPSESVTSYRSGGRWENRFPTDRDWINATVNQYRGPQPDTGHEFNSVKQSLVSHDSGKSIYAFWNGTFSRQLTYSGPIMFHGWQNGFVPSGASSYYTTDGKIAYPTVPDVSLVWGTKAIGRSIPTNPLAHLMTAALEFKQEGRLPHVPGAILGHTVNKKELLKHSADEYLNAIFGVVPLARDVQDLMKSFANFNKIVMQLKRDSDRMVRRRFVFPTQKSTSSFHLDGVNFDKAYAFANSYISNYGNITTGSGALDIKVTKSDKIWFSGAFRYHLPTDKDLWNRMERTSDAFNRALGSGMDVRNVYSALPWTWLVDWFVDVSDIVKYGQFQTTYQGILQYGYLMCESTYTHEHTLTGVTIPGTGYVTSLSTSAVTKRKQRVKATPYGFGLNPSSFTETQWAILGALGISKGAKSLW